MFQYLNKKNVSKIKKIQNCSNSHEVKFQIFIFRVMVIFVLNTPQFLMNFHDNSKNRNRKIDFSFISAHCASCYDNLARKLLIYDQLCLAGTLLIDNLFIVPTKCTLRLLRNLRVNKSFEFLSFFFLHKNRIKTEGRLHIQSPLFRSRVMA